MKLDQTAKAVFLTNSSRFRSVDALFLQRADAQYRTRRIRNRRLSRRTRQRAIQTRSAVSPASSARRSARQASRLSRRAATMDTRTTPRYRHGQCIYCGSVGGLPLMIVEGPNGICRQTARNSTTTKIASGERRAGREIARILRRCASR